MLCDGASPENIASTVVDCTKIETGQIGFFRVGLIPKSKVIHLLLLFSLTEDSFLHLASAFAPFFPQCIYLCYFLQVLQIFEEVQRKHRQGQTNFAFEYDQILLNTQSDRPPEEEDS